MVKELNDCGLVRSFKKESDGTSYQLTDKGIMFSSIIKDKIDNTESFDILDFFKWVVVKE